MADPSKMTPEELQTLLNGPGGKPPAGVTPNFDHPPNLKGALYAVSSICIIVATLAVFARLYTKARVIRSVGKEDYVAILAWLCFIGYGVALFFMYIDCPGVHQWNIRFKYLRRHFYVSSRRRNATHGQDRKLTGIRMFTSLPKCILWPYSSPRPLSYCN